MTRKRREIKNEDHSPAPSAQFFGEDLTQRRKGAKDAEEEGRREEKVFVRKHSVKFHAYLAYNNPFSSLGVLCAFASLA